MNKIDDIKCTFFYCLKCTETIEADSKTDSGKDV